VPRVECRASCVVRRVGGSRVVDTTLRAKKHENNGIISLGSRLFSPLRGFG
jgi:hypothetical protein